MADRPILFSAPMIRALLDGRKTQTRRAIKPQPFSDGYYDEEIDCTLVPAPARNLSDYFRFGAAAVGGGAVRTKTWEPPYAAGDRLWVREAHALVGCIDPGWLLYRASGYEAECARHGFDKPYPAESKVRWRPSIHMPRRLSRLTLVVTDVRVERLQDISEADAKAEGIERLKSGRGFYDPTVGRSLVRVGHYFRRASDSYSALWDHINGPGSWDANPWVAAYTFNVHCCNIDSMEGRQ